MADHSSQPTYKQLDTKIVSALERVSEVFRIMLWNHAKSTGLSPIQIQILIYIRHHKEHLRRVVHLAHDFNLTKATISDAVKSLEEKELITKMQDPADARSQVLKLTVKGNKLAMNLASFADPLKAQLERVDTASKAKFYEMLLDMLHGLIDTEVINMQRMCQTCSFFEPDDTGGHCVFLKKHLTPGEYKVDCPAHEKPAA